METDATLMKWRPIPGTPYEISECGDVRHCKTLRRLRGYINTDGYLAYHIGRKHALAHVLVARAYLPEPQAGQTQVAHKNGSRLLCHWENLRWSTPLENHQDRRIHGTGPIGERNPRAKITAADVRYIRTEYRRIKTPASGRKVTELEQRFGLHRATILDIAKGRSWTHVD